MHPNAIVRVYKVNTGRYHHHAMENPNEDPPGWRLLKVLPLTPAQPHLAYWMPDLEWGRGLWHAHTPYTHAVYAEQYEDVMGMAAFIRFGDTALLDLLYIHPDERRRGIGTTLLNALLEQAAAEGLVPMVQAPPALVPFFARHGFAPQEELLRCTGGHFYEATLDEVTNMEPEHLMAALHLDRRAFGEDRRTWLLEHSYLGSVYVEQGRVRGFSLPLLRDALIVADSPAVGLELQRWVFPTQEHMIIPASNTAALQHLHERGYSTTVEAVRMVRGEAPPFKGNLVYAHP